MSQEKLETMIMQNFEGVKEVYYGICASRECHGWPPMVMMLPLISWRTDGQSRDNQNFSDR